MYCSESFYQAEEGWDFGKESRMPRGEAGSITGFCLAIGKVGGKEGYAFRYLFFFFLNSFWAFGYVCRLGLMLSCCNSLTHGPEGISAWNQ